MSRFSLSDRLAAETLLSTTEKLTLEIGRGVDGEICLDFVLKGSSHSLHAGAGDIDVIETVPPLKLAALLLAAFGREGGGA